jgi:UDP-N-acetylmuramoylalanine--D-glutamate ligase
MDSKLLGNVAVLGLGKTGLAVTDYLADQLGTRATSVTLFGGARAQEGEQTRELEARGVRVVCGTEELDGSYDLAVVSPGIPEDSAFFLSACDHAAEVVGEPEFAWRESPERWVAITGTNGKTTTTLLTTELLKAGGLDAKAVGNVGTVATGEVAHRGEDEWFVAELSSFQLAGAHQLHPHVACLLNVTPDHLEWHGSMEAYAAAKERIFKNLGQGDLAVVSVEDEWCRSIATRLEDRGIRVCRVAVHADPKTPCAAFVRDGRLVVRLDGVEHTLVLLESLVLKGDHNYQNALVASAVALEVGVPCDAVSHGLLAFKPLEPDCGVVETAPGRIHKAKPYRSGFQFGGVDGHAGPVVRNGVRHNRFAAFGERKREYRFDLIG